MTSTQKKMLPKVTIEVENGLLSLSHPVTVILVGAVLIHTGEA
jgi:hypothetical protein